MDTRGRLIYAHEGGRLMVTKPIDGKPATAANGGTIGIAARMNMTYEVEKDRLDLYDGANSNDN